MTVHPEALVDEAEGVITVTFDREAKRNAISPAMTAVLWDAVRALGDRDDLRCMVIRARGSYFSAGIDLALGAGDRRTEGPSQPGWAYRRNYRSHHLLYDEIEAVEKPVVLAAQGPVIGAGVELAVSCDFRLCTPEATWRLPEVALGALPGSGGMSRLTRLVGPQWAKWMSMAGKAVGAEEAARLGLVHEVLPAEDLDRAVQDLCACIVALPPEAVGLAKATIDLVTDIGERSAQRAIERIANTTLRVGNDQFTAHAQRFGGARSNEDGS